MQLWLQQELAFINRQSLNAVQPLPLVREIKNDIKAARKMYLPWWGVLCVSVGTLLVAWLFDRWGRLDLVMPGVMSIAVVGFVAALKWQMRTHVWFWITITILAALHVLLILFVPWTTKHIPAAALAGGASVDFCVMIAIFEVIWRLVERRKSVER